MNETTLNYYNNNATAFVNGTKDARFSSVQDKFLGMLKAGSKILDFGCGSGRDTKYFREKGYEVDATDGSNEICKIASEYTGIKVRQMLFAELDAVNEYDGIWACSSILHLRKSELKDVLRKMAAATKPYGYIYASFKYGEFEGYRGERFFTDFTEETFAEFVKDMNEIEIMEYWISADVRPGRGEERWLNLMLRKMNTV